MAAHCYPGCPVLSLCAALEGPDAADSNATRGRSPQWLQSPHATTNCASQRGQYDRQVASSGAGGPGQVVVYEVAINWHPLTPLLLPFLGSDGTLRLTAGLAVRNEPYPTTP